MASELSATALILTTSTSSSTPCPPAPRCWRPSSLIVRSRARLAWRFGTNFVVLLSVHVVLAQIVHRGLHQIAVVTVQYFRSEEHTSELQSLTNIVCRLLLEK